MFIGSKTDLVNKLSYSGAFKYIDLESINKEEKSISLNNCQPYYYTL